METEYVILVDAQDQEIGQMEKQEAHIKGLLHRAFSVFVFNSAGELILQRRALDKYHSGGLWSNTCCSHPRSGESVFAAAHRRLQEEMGFDCELEHAFSFIYEQQVGTLMEHELDHVFVGRFDGVPQLNPDEVAEWRVVSMEKLQEDLHGSPEEYTVWIRICLDRVAEYLRSHRHRY
jgi:isopentenyl-diphosphate delta-isomerase